MIDLENINNRVLFFIIVLVTGVFGGHWFIQKDIKKGLLYLFTFGGFFMCWIYDVIKSFINIFDYNSTKFLTSRDKNITRQKSYEEQLRISQYYENQKIALKQIEMHSENFNRILKDVQCGFKNLDPYLSRYRILLNLYEQMEELNTKFNLNVLVYDRKQLFETLNTSLIDFINKKIIVIIEKHSIDTDEGKALKKDLMKTRNEIIEVKHEYHEFSDLFQEIQFKIENEINTCN